MKDKRLAFVQGLTCIDLVTPDGRGMYSRETLEQVRLRYPGAEERELGAWTEEKERALCTPAKPITKERFNEMLEVLPPQRWQIGRNCESFEMCEHTSGRVTAIFCRFGPRYYSFEGITGQTLEEHAKHCGEVKS